MTLLGWILLGIPSVLFLYAYFGYPAVLKVLSAFRPPFQPLEEPEVWPTVSISLPVYNEEARVRETLESLLGLDYPREKVQIVVVSDASTDRTDEIVERYADRGVELLKLPERAGKTAAENAARSVLRGEIVINTDASIRILPSSLKPLVRAFGDPSVGVASGWDASVASVESEATGGEARYVGYEMRVRGLETRLGSIVGASGCFYAIRRELHSTLVPVELSRDFASALVAREHGFRSVSVQDAVCLVPRAASLRAELRRKVRTMARGLDTLSFKRHLMNPFRYRGFAWKLISHKLCRWLVPLTLPLGLVGLLILAFHSRVAAILLPLAAVVAVAGLAGLCWPEGRRIPRPLAIAGYVVVANVAGWMAWVRVVQRDSSPTWEPTRRGPSA